MIHTVRVEWKNIKYDYVLPRKETFYFPRHYPETVDNVKYWEIVRVLHVDFIMKYEDYPKLYIVSLEGDEQEVPILGYIVLKIEQDKQFTVEHIILSIDNLIRYKVIDYIDDIVRTGLLLLNTSNSDEISLTINNLIPHMLDKETGTYIITPSKNELRDEHVIRKISAFNNITESLYSYNIEDELLLQLIELVQELNEQGHPRVYYSYGNWDEPIFIIEIPPIDDIDETGWIVLTRYKNRSYDIRGVIMNSDYVKPLTKDVVLKTIKYYKELNTKTEHDTNQYCY